MRTIEHFIDGRRVAAQSDRHGEVYNPATGEVIAQVPFAAPAEVDAAVSAASDAWPGWRDTSLAARTKVMFRFRDLVEGASDELAAIITEEHGKVTADALAEVQRGLEVVEFACGLPHLLKGDFSQNVSTGVDAYSVHQPLGVVAGVTPFNFPAMVPMWMFPVAIACGNTFVLKPSERDPSASVRLAELFVEAGLPAGVFNVVHGDKVSVDALLEHQNVAAISSVGSTPVARYIYETAARHGKRVQALGGAKNHMVVLPDADMDQAADALVGAAYGSAGERCMAISAVVAVGDAADPLIERVTTRIASLTIGAGTADDSDMGPLITGPHRDKVASFVEAGVAEGAELVVDGRDVGADDDGFFLGPCLFDRVTPEMSIYQEEIFGPVLSIVRSPTLDDAIELVNRNPYGNGTAIFTRDGGAARAYQYAVEVGMVGINVSVPVPMAFYSFGGWKHSLFGDAHVHGTEGIRFYTRTKAVSARWPAEEAGAKLNFPTA